MASPIYTGFSTKAMQETKKSFLVRNMECVKADLLNHIYTIPGERVMNPEFGTRISMLAFEPLDEQTVDIVREDLTKVINYDPRVSLIDMAIMPLPDNSAIIAYVDLLYIELNAQDTIRLDFPLGS